MDKDYERIELMAISGAAIKGVIIIKECLNQS